ncbi:MAG: hypothetical protein LBO74_17955 [Candidatus Symbiothrix sp.]|jgi:hypothetical protein|nr:hypothetical protein [Candidatus Symbiothrix sp.]
MESKTKFILFFLLVFGACAQSSKDNNTTPSTQDILQIQSLSDSIQFDSLKYDNPEASIELFPSSIRVQDDSLYFTYKLTNKSPNTLLFYHVQYFHFRMESYTESDFPKDGHWFPRCFIWIMDGNGKLPEYMMTRLLHYMLPGSELPQNKLPAEYDAYSYVKLAANENRAFSISQFIGNLPLIEGNYKFKLQYFSPPNDYFEQRFKREKKRRNLKDSKLFQGIVESNICSFTYPTDNKEITK